jgi:hypothetical protein
MTGGNISHCTALYGEGIFVSQYGGIFTQTSGTISGNNGKPDIKQ